jgi:hypothetical protein
MSNRAGPGRLSFPHPSRPARSQCALKPLSDVSVPLAVHAVEVIRPAERAPRDASGVIGVFRHVEDGADFIYL